MPDQIYHESTRAVLSLVITYLFSYVREMVSSYIRNIWYTIRVCRAICGEIWDLSHHSHPFTLFLPLDTHLHSERALYSFRQGHHFTNMQQEGVSQPINVCLRWWRGQKDFAEQFTLPAVSLILCVCLSYRLQLTLWFQHGRMRLTVWAFRNGTEITKERGLRETIGPMNTSVPQGWFFCGAVMIYNSPNCKPW